MDLLDLVSPSILDRSGAVFYSGRVAFASPCRVYLLGLNPGGSPDALRRNTVAESMKEWRQRTESAWSAYADESWANARAGQGGMQPEVLHLLRNLNLDVRRTPASNVIFVRSRSEPDLRSEKVALMEACWPVHLGVLKATRADTLICLGKTAGAWVREQLGAHSLLGSYVETNARRWVSSAHTTSDGMCVITLTHPSRAKWRTPAADPSAFVRDILARPGRS